MNPMTRLMTRTCLAAVTTLACTATSIAEDAKLDGDSVVTDRHRIAIASTALPEQLTIPAAPSELPLDARGDGKATAAVLAEIGRGDMLRAPIRVEATIAGNATIYEAGAARKVPAGGEINAQAKGKAGAVPVAVKAQYSGGGIMVFAITYGGAGTDVDSLDVVLDLVGPVDTAVAGPVALDKAKPAALDPAPYQVGQEEGLAWQESDGKPGFPTPTYLGSGDRGFSFAASEAGFQGDAAKPALTVSREKAGDYSIRVRLVNSPTTLTAAATATLTIYPHPAKMPDPAARLQAWQPWTAGKDGYVSAERLESPGPDAKGIVLAGAYGGLAIDADTPLTDVFPITLFRYLSGHQTGLPAQLQPSKPADYNAGANPGLDRMALGRALLHDIGIDAHGLAHATDAAVMAKALHEFGYFSGDADTYFVPYWRSAGLARYGEVFTQGDSFETTAENPMARVHTSIFMRPGDQPGTYRAMMIVVNESDKPVRELLYITDPARLFGEKGNALMGSEINKQWDASGLPAASDWQPSKLVVDTSKAIGEGAAKKRVALPFLRDMEDGGYVIQSAKAEGTEVYGPLHIPARSYRIVYGHGMRAK